MFRLGQKVICVDGKHYIGDPISLPIKGQIYTVTAVGLTHPLDPHQLPCILVAEFPERSEKYPLWQHRFRPVVERKTDISLFKAMLNPSKQKERA